MYLRADDQAELLHAIAGAGDVLGVEVVGGEVGPAGFRVNETVAGEVDENAVVGFGEGREPTVDFLLEVGEGGAGTA